MMACAKCERERPIVANGQCRSCYTIEWRKKNADRHRLRCANPACGKEFTSHKANQPTCSQRCTWAIKPSADKAAQASVIVLKQAARSSFAALRRAYETRDMPTLRDEIRKHSIINPDTGCWEWGGTRMQKPNGKYAMLSIGRRNFYVHRLSAMTRYGDFGTEPVVHHACHVTHCVNPEHVAPVTIRENSSEMLERQHYINRISCLEDALRAVSPDHPLLWDDFDRTPTAITDDEIQGGM